MSSPTQPVTVPFRQGFWDIITGAGHPFAQSHRQTGGMPLPDSQVAVVVAASGLIFEYYTGTRKLGPQ